MMTRNSRRPAAVSVTTLLIVVVMITTVTVGVQGRAFRTTSAASITHDAMYRTSTASSSSADGLSEGADRHGHAFVAPANGRYQSQQYQYNMSPRDFYSAMAAAASEASSPSPSATEREGRGMNDNDEPDDRTTTFAFCRTNARQRQRGYGVGLDYVLDDEEPLSGWLQTEHALWSEKRHLGSRPDRSASRGSAGLSSYHQSHGYDDKNDESRLVTPCMRKQNLRRLGDGAMSLSSEIIDV